MVNISLMILGVHLKTFLHLDFLQMAVDQVGLVR